ncbi:uncharacterized protein LOC135808131 [Sycon ciliatum]|uniref:uncharacterized protein LOC135808131 n=1 Tax=Sycon ciliatum TaxID=27933 RepID=UPI0031F636D5
MPPSSTIGRSTSSQLLAYLDQSQDDLPVPGPHEPDCPQPGRPATFDLPVYTETARINFVLGTMTAEECANAINRTYDEAVHFRPNAFDVLSGGVGKDFVNQLSQYLLVFGNAGPFEGQALKVAMVFQLLLLQKPFQAATSSHAKCLKRRLELWRAGALSDLPVNVAPYITSWKSNRRNGTGSPVTTDNARRFASLVTDGKLGAALQYLDDDTSGGILDLDDRIGDRPVRDILVEKHPLAEPTQPAAVLPGTPPAPPHPVRFEALTRDVVRRAALSTHGAAGPSGVDADTWRRMCTGFGVASDDLCDAVASCARRLATSMADPWSLEAHTSCRLIPLDKKPGVRPIGIGEVLRRIVGKAILSLLRDDILEAAGSLQLCSGHECGVEAAIHAMREVFADDETEGLLLADASNAFNCLNRAVYLQNIQHLCPAMSPVVINTYRQPAQLFVGGEVILSSEVSTANTVQAWFADDSGAGGKLMPLRAWWHSLTEQGLAYGYHLNPSKSVLLVKPEHYDRAVEMFADTGAAYAALTQGLQNKWSFLCRTTPTAAAALTPVEKLLMERLIPALTGHIVNSEERSILALPCRHGGLGLGNPVDLASQYDASRRVTESLQTNIKLQTMALGSATSLVRTAKAEVRITARNAVKAHALLLRSSVPEAKQRVIDLAAEKGSSSWLTCRPLKRHGFALSKAEFRDGVHLRYNWQPQRMPSGCVCGSQFTVAHALSCPTGGYPTIRHNEIRDVTAGFLKRVATNVSVEPHLEPLSGEHLSYRTAIRDDQPRLDVAANGVWGGRFERTFFDVRVFNPFASSNQSSSISATYVRQEKAKKRSYEERLREIEHASFVPLVFSTTGGMGKQSASLYKRIASLIAEKSGEPYSVVMSFIRCRLSFALLRASVMCLRGGSRSVFAVHAPVSSSASLVAAEAGTSRH